MKHPTFSLQPGHRLEWAILAPASAAELEAIVRALDPYADEYDDPPTRAVIAGTGTYAAVIETAPGSSGTEDELATGLARALGATVYAVGFAGYDDPDHGLPSIVSHDGDQQRLLWMTETLDDDIPQPETYPGPAGIPCDDPFAFADALGCALRGLY